MKISKIWGKCCDALADVPVIGGILKPRPKVAVIRLSGIIAESAPRRQSISFDKLAPLIESAFEVYNLKAVALVINSPGGSPAQSQLIGDHIRQFAKEKDIPVLAFVEDVAASGGYWLACAADEIYATAVSIVGSIGVISASFGFQDLIERYGVERRVHASGKDKGFLDPFQSEKPSDVKRLKAIQKDIHDAFITWVKNRRGDKLNGEDKDLFEGQFWASPAAMSKGIIDDQGDLRSVCREKFGEEVKFKDFSPDKSLLSNRLGARIEHTLDGTELKNQALKSRYGV